MGLRELMNMFSLLGHEGVQKAMLEAASHEKAVTISSSNNAQLIYQAGGMFAQTGNDNKVLSTMVTPRGITASLPSYASNLTDPRFPLFTGWSARQGSRPATPCDNGPSGFMTGGTLTAAFGRLQHDTATLKTSELTKQVRGVNTNLQLIGSMLGDTGFLPNVPGQGGIFNNVVAAQMMGVGVQYERDLAALAWQGTPANNNVGGGHKEFPGLDAQIATGQKDAETNATLPAADSYVIDYNYAAVDSTTKDIVNDMLYMEQYLFHLAERTGMAPVTWKIVMRPELWYELSAIWPSRYNTNRGTTMAGTNVISINDNYNIVQRDNMRRGKTIELNGRVYMVETDDGIYEYNNENSTVAAGSYASAVYFVPLTVIGSFPVLYFEYFDFKQSNGLTSVLGAGARNVEFWTDDGRYNWVFHSDGFCFKLQAESEMRLVLRTPWLAGKISKIRYTPAKHLSSYDPNSPYWLSGGASMTTVPTPGYAVWR